MSKRQLSSAQLERTVRELVAAGESAVEAEEDVERFRTVEQLDEMDPEVATLV